MAKILLAEDEQQIGDMVAFKLGHAWRDVVRVADGEAALAAAARERSNVIILDVMMPIMDGFTVLGRLKADPALRAVPVIMLTARGQERDVLSGARWTYRRWTPTGWSGNVAGASGGVSALVTARWTGSSVGRARD